MKIFVTGTRGIPDIPGGVEKHCQELFPRIAEKGHEVFLCTRKPYMNNQICEWKGVKLINVFSPKIKSLETIVHTFLSLFKAQKYHPNIIHIHSIGPAILTPIARLFGFKVVVTNHGPEYQRQKWGRLAKYVLRLGERVGCCRANEVIVISKIIADIVRAKCKKEPHIIFNGVKIRSKNENTEFLDKIGVTSKEYILTVARFVPEKGIHDLVSAFKLLNCNQKLVIVGDADHESSYSRKLKRLAADDKRIVLTGYITGKPLEQIYSHAKLFVLPSYYEGLPIALLEAISYKLSVLISDIPPHREIELLESRYFKCNNINDLKCKIEIFLNSPESSEEIEKYFHIVKEKYNWDNIAKQTINVYYKMIEDKNGNY